LSIRAGSTIQSQDTFSNQKKGGEWGGEEEGKREKEKGKEKREKE
jgi:hypothetical protein